MPDPDDAPDPIDNAYAEAEAVLSDDAARATRRARVLGAVAQAPAQAAPPARRTVWRRGGWLVAASVAALGTLLATQIRLPTPLAAPPAAPPAQTSATQAPVIQAPASQTSTAQAPTMQTPAAPAAAGPAVAPAPAPLQAPSSQGVAGPPAAPPAAPPPAPPPPPAPSPSPGSDALRSTQAAAPPADVVAERPAPADGAATPSGGFRDNALDGQGFARGAGPQAVAPAAASSRRMEAAARPPADPAASLRAAAAAGRTSEVQALLNQGVAVDAADADGNTALMQSIQADHPAAAALLRRHGASLDRRNHAGQSARDMATAIGDPVLDEAIGLTP